MDFIIRPVGCRHAGHVRGIPGTARLSPVLFTLFVDTYMAKWIELAINKWFWLLLRGCVK